MCQVKEAKKKRAKDDAAVDAVGDVYRSCAPIGWIVGPSWAKTSESGWELVFQSKKQM